MLVEATGSLTSWHPGAALCARVGWSGTGVSGRHPEVRPIQAMGPYIEYERPFGETIHASNGTIWREEKMRHTEIDRDPRDPESRSNRESVGY